MDKKNLIKNILLTVVYAIFTLFIVLHHEIWADEAQVWLICKNLNVIELFKHLVNEGHPSFFYLLIMPFAKLLHGTNAILSMQLICWVSSCAAVFLLWQFSPFNKWAKAAITLSAGFLYFFPVIARSYSIIPLVVFLLAMVYPKRHEKPILYGVLIAICANIHVIMFGFCAMLTLLFFVEEILKKEFSKKYISSFLIMFLGLLAVVLQLHGTTDSNVCISYDFKNILDNALKIISQFFINSYDEFFRINGEVIFPKIGHYIIALSVFVYINLFIILFFNNKKMFFISSFGILFQIVVYIITYNFYMYNTRIFCAHIILLFAFWQMLSESNFKPKFKIINQKATNILLILFFIFTTLNGFRFCYLDLFNNFSSAKETAEFIEKNIDSNNSVLFTDNAVWTISLVYYLGEKYDIYEFPKNKKIDYIIWDENAGYYLYNEGYKQVAEKLKKTLKNNNKKFYAIIPHNNKINMGIKNPIGYEKIFDSKPSVKLEGFTIYQYKE